MIVLHQDDGRPPLPSWQMAAATIRRHLESIPLLHDIVVSGPRRRRDPDAVTSLPELFEGLPLRSGRDAAGRCKRLRSLVMLV